MKAPRARWLLVAMIALAVSTSTNCASRFGVTPDARPPIGSEVDEVFQSLRAARERAGKKPPGWVARLAALANDGAQRLGEGADKNAVTNDIGSRAAYTIMRNVETWWFVSDALTLSEWPPKLLARDGLLVAIGVSLMQTTAPGRHTILVIIVETGR